MCNYVTLSADRLLTVTDWLHESTALTLLAHNLTSYPFVCLLALSKT